MAFFPTFFLQAIQARKMSFVIFYNDKTSYQAIKTSSLKSRKIDIFPKGLTHAFGPKMADFPTFCLGNIGHENVYYDILERKNAFLDYKRTRSKSRKIDIFPKGLTHVFGQNMAFFPFFFFQAIQARKMSFTIFQNEKTSYQAIKTRSLKRRKMDIFPKGLTHDFGPKMAIFPSFFFSTIEARKMSITIFQNEKTPFQSIKRRIS